MKQHLEGGSDFAEGIYPPGLGANVAGVKYGAALILDEKHDRAHAMVRIKQSDTDLSSRSEFKQGWRLERYWLEQLLQVTICLDAPLKYAFGEVHAMLKRTVVSCRVISWIHSLTHRILLKTEQNFSGCRRAVNERRPTCFKAVEMIRVHMTEEVGECRLRRLVFSEMVDPDVRELCYVPVEG